MKLLIVSIVFIFGTTLSTNLGSAHDPQQVMISKYKALLDQYLNILNEINYHLSKILESIETDLIPEIIVDDNSTASSIPQDSENDTDVISPPDQNSTATELPSEPDFNETTIDTNEEQLSNYSEDDSPINSTATSESRLKRSASPTNFFSLQNVSAILTQLDYLTSDIYLKNLTAEKLSEFSFLLDQLSDISKELGFYSDKLDTSNYDDLTNMKQRLERTHTTTFGIKRDLTLENPANLGNEKVKEDPNVNEKNSTESLDNLVIIGFNKYLLITIVVSIFVGIALIISCICFLHKWRQTRKLSKILKTFETGKTRNLLQCNRVNKIETKKVLSERHFPTVYDQHGPAKKLRARPLFLEDGAVFYKNSSTDTLGDPIDDIYYQGEITHFTRPYEDDSSSPVLGKPKRNGPTKLMRYNPETFQPEASRKTVW